MTEVASAYVTLLPSAKGFEGKLASEIGSPTERVGKQAGTRFASGMRTSLLGSAKSLVGVVGGAFAVAKVGQFFGDAIEGASDLSESANAVSVTFGEADKAIFEFARSAPRRLGQTELAARNAATTFGAFGKSAGLTGKELADFSTDTATLASDLASFKNTTPEEAIEAIGAALRGEAEPIRKYNVLLDDATLRQRALKLGLIKTTKDALTPQQKVLAAHAEIFKQTTDAQGDFGRTSDGLANQQRILSARFDQVQNKIGRALLPVTTDLVQFLNREGVPAFKDFAQFLVKDAIPAIVDFGEDMAPLAKELLPALGDALGAGKDILKEAVPLAKDFVGAFNSLPDGVKKAVAVGGLAGGLALKLKGSNFGKLLGGVIPSKPIPVFVVNNGLGGAGDLLGGKKGGRLKGVPLLGGPALATGGALLSLGGDSVQTPEWGKKEWWEALKGGSSNLKDNLDAVAHLLGTDLRTGFLGLSTSFEDLDSKLSDLVVKDPAKAFRLIRLAARDSKVSVDELTQKLPLTRAEVDRVRGEVKDFGGAIDHSRDVTRLLMGALGDLGKQKVIPVVDLDTSRAEAKVAALSRQLVALGASNIPIGIRSPDLIVPNNPLAPRTSTNRDLEKSVERGARAGTSSGALLSGTRNRMDYP